MSEYCDSWPDLWAWAIGELRGRHVQLRTPIQPWMVSGAAIGFGSSSGHHEALYEWSLTQVRKRFRGRHRRARMNKLARHAKRPNGRPRHR